VVIFSYDPDNILGRLENDRVIRIEILDASKQVNLEKLSPVKYEVSRKVI